MTATNNGQATIQRKTSETDLALVLNLYGQGNFNGSSGIGFFDHMLQLLCRHGRLDLSLQAKGDLDVDGHHTVEDIGICLGQAINQALGDKAGISRYGHAYVPMDETLVRVCLDLSGRPYLQADLEITVERIGQFETQLVEEFFRAVVYNGGITLHIHQLEGVNGHHIVEAVFKAFGRALRLAVTKDPELGGEVLSTKGRL